MLHKKLHFHFMGIGGIGMSAIAKILALQGHVVSGCDSTCDEKNIKELLSLGVIICKGHAQEICKDQSINILVYSSAIKKDHTEIIAAQENNVQIMARAEVLAELMKNKCGIAVAGSHGKTTTTSLISHVLRASSIDPTIIVGGHMNNLNSNAHSGTSDILVAEADESDRSFLYLEPSLAVITNIDLEHLETYSNIEDIKNTFLAFTKRIKENGTAIVCIDDQEVATILPHIGVKSHTYGTKPEADTQAINISLEATSSTFSILHKNELLGTIQLPIPGRHNVLNALAAICTALELGITFEQIQHALHSFLGVQRRFTLHGSWKNAEIFDDYGHHPKEIESTLLVAQRRTKSRLHIVFQPHRYSRTKHLWGQFVETFASSSIDSLTITDIYPASELPIDGINAEKLVEDIKKLNPALDVCYEPLESNFQSIKTKLESLTKPNDLILFLGAGKINQLAQLLTTPK